MPAKALESYIECMTFLGVTAHKRKTICLYFNDKNMCLFTRVCDSQALLFNI